MREHNKYMKSIGCHNLVMNLKEFTDYCQGTYKSKNRDFKPLKQTESYVRKTEYIPVKIVQKVSHLVQGKNHNNIQANVNF